MDKIPLPYMLASTIAPVTYGALEGKYHGLGTSAASAPVTRGADLARDGSDLWQSCSASRAYSLDDVLYARRRVAEASEVFEPHRFVDECMCMRSVLSKFVDKSKGDVHVRAPAPTDARQHCGCPPAGGPRGSLDLELPLRRMPAGLRIDGVASAQTALARAALCSAGSFAHVVPPSGLCSINWWQGFCGNAWRCR